MAQEALERQAERMGYPVKVETNGSGGVKNRLTPGEIEAAECIIIAADKNVEMARFDGKRVFRPGGGRYPQTGRTDPSAVSGQAPVYHYHGSDGAGEAGKG